MRRIRETLFKLIVIVGVCKPLEAIFDIDAVTKLEDKDYTFSRYEGMRELVVGQRANVEAEKDGNAMKRIRSVALRGWTGFMRTTWRVLTMCLLRRKTLVKKIPCHAISHD
jgi:hypothetical protein